MMSYLSQLYNCFRRKNMLHLKKFFFRTFVVRVKVHFRFRLVLKIEKTREMDVFKNFNLTSFSNFCCARSISFQTCLKSSKKNCQFHNIFRASDFISLYISKCFDLTSFFLFLSFQNWRMSPKSQIS